MLKLSTIIGSYNHIPDGMSNAEFEEIYLYCYRPFLRELYIAKDVQACLFYSGSLISRLKEFHPEFLVLLKTMINRRQVEILGGAYYSPILPIVPNSDKISQIELLTSCLRMEFGKRPRAAWLTEYAWEPWMASVLQSAGMEYSFLSSEQFYTAYGSKDKKLEPVITEDQGHCLTMFPVIDVSANDFSRFSLDSVLSCGQKSTIPVIMVQGEKIRELSEASGEVSTDLFMEKVFAWFKTNASVIETTTANKYLKSHKPRERLYFSGSATKNLIKSISPCGLESNGICLRNIITSSVASASLHAKIYYVHLQVQALRGDKIRKKVSQEQLLRGQSADAVWLNGNSGIAKPENRANSYKALIEAELATRQKGIFKSGIINTDFDFDGIKEYLYQGSDVNIYIHPRGGSIFEIDIFKTKTNLCDVFSNTRDNNFARKSCFIDRIYNEQPDTSRVCAPWTSDVSKLSDTIYDEVEKDFSKFFIKLSSSTELTNNEIKSNIKIQKAFTFQKKSIKLGYEISNQSKNNISFYFGTELNLSLKRENIESIITENNEFSSSLLNNNSGLDLGEIIRLSIKSDLGKNISISTIRPGKISMAIIQYIYDQGTSILINWPISLAPDEKWQTDIVFSLIE